MTKTGAWAVAMLASSGLCQLAAAKEATGNFHDHQRIVGVLKQYIAALDSNDADLYAGAFAPHGARLMIRDVTRSGREEIRKEVTGEQTSTAPRPVAWHFMSNSRIEFTGRRSARHHAYYQVWTRLNDQPGGVARLTTPITMVAIGRYDDELVKVGEQWFIQTRRITPDTSGGY